MSTKTFSLLLLAALAAAQVPDQAPPLLKSKKIQVGQPKEIAVTQPAVVAIPITLVAGDYKGPYDPRDPDGVMAATRRRNAIVGEATSKEIKSYIPPGTAEFLKKEVVKLLVNEARRFTVAHPKETAELLGIFNKGLALYKTTSRKITDLEKKQASAKKI